MQTKRVRSAWPDPSSLPRQACNLQPLPRPYTHSVYTVYYSWLIQPPSKTKPVFDSKTTLCCLVLTSHRNHSHTNKACSHLCSPVIHECFSSKDIAMSLQNNHQKSDAPATICWMPVHRLAKGRNKKMKVKQTLYRLGQKLSFTYRLNSKWSANLVVVVIPNGASRQGGTRSTGEFNGRMQGATGFLKKSLFRGRGEHSDVRYQECKRWRILILCGWILIYMKPRHNRRIALYFYGVKSSR